MESMQSVRRVGGNYAIFFILEGTYLLKRRVDSTHPSSKGEKGSFRSFIELKNKFEKEKFFWKKLLYKYKSF